MTVTPKTQTIPLELLATAKKFTSFPLTGMTAQSIIQPFGANYVWYYKALGLLGHNGADLRASTGTKALAVFDGVVKDTYYEASGGNQIEIVTDSFTVPSFPGTYRLRVFYLHLQKFLVADGQHVVSGQPIAQTNNTGRYTTGAHLHVSVKVDKLVGETWETLDKDNGFNGAVDPEAFFPDKTYQLLPVDYRYGLPVSLIAEAYKRREAMLSFLRLRWKRTPTQRELNGFAYGKWAVEEVENPAFFNLWTQRTKPYKAEPQGL